MRAILRRSEVGDCALGGAQTPESHERLPRLRPLLRCRPPQPGPGPRRRRRLHSRGCFDPPPRPKHRPLLRARVRGGRRSTAKGQAHSPPINARFLHRPSLCGAEGSGVPTRSSKGPAVRPAAHDRHCSGPSLGACGRGGRKPPREARTFPLSPSLDSSASGPERRCNLCRPASSWQPQWRRGWPDSRRPPSQLPSPVRSSPRQVAL